jgi:hypothetical protein
VLHHNYNVFNNALFAEEDIFDLEGGSDRMIEKVV